MRPRPEIVEELISELASLPIELQRDRHLMITKCLLEVATLPEIRALRREAAISPLCEFLGALHRDALLDMIDGYESLRRLGVVHRQRHLDNL